MAENHAKHSAESYRLALARTTPGSPAEDAIRAQARRDGHGEIELSAEHEANLGLFADAGGMIETGRSWRELS